MDKTKDVTDTFNHAIQLSERKNIIVTGVKKLDNFDVVVYDDGRMVVGATSIAMRLFDAGVKIGDKVVLNKYAGTEVECDDKKYYIVSQKDILAIVE